MQRLENETKTNATVQALLTEKIKTSSGRKWLVKNFGFPMWLKIYLGHYFTKEFGLVHHIIMESLMSADDRFVALTSFRECGKSTITTLGYPLYCICEQIYKFGIIVSETEEQSTTMIKSIKNELESNKILIEDYGDLIGEYWSMTSIETRTGIKWVGKSKGQRVRGIKYKQYRPQIIILDDPQSLDSVATAEKRKKDLKWFNAEIFGALGQEHGRLFFIGNLLHDDGLLNILSKKPIYKSYFLGVTHDCTEDGMSMWKARFPDKAAIEAEKMKHDPIFWAREFMLKMMPEDGQVIKEVFYIETVPKHAEYLISAVGIDLAISKKQTADYTVMVKGSVWEYNGKILIHIDDVLKKRLSLRETINEAKTFCLDPDGYYCPMFVESVAYQQACIEEMEREGMPVEGMKTGTADKKARLQSVSPMIQNGLVLFNRNTTGDLQTELINFGVEKNDDTVDALVWLLKGLQKFGLQKQEVKVV